MRKLCLMALALFSCLAFAQTYRWIDPATGKTMITDIPPPRTVKTVDKLKKGESEQSGPESFATRRAAENFPVTLYASADCIAECKDARNLLNKRGVPFNEKLLQTKEDADELKALVGEPFIPSLKVCLLYTSRCV